MRSGFRLRAYQETAVQYLPRENGKDPGAPAEGLVLSTARAKDLQMARVCLEEIPFSVRLSAQSPAAVDDRDRGMLLKAKAVYTAWIPLQSPDHQQSLSADVA